MFAGGIGRTSLCHSLVFVYTPHTRAPHALTAFCWRRYQCLVPFVGCAAVCGAMSGAKRRSKYRKHVQAALLDALPEPAEGELVAMVKHTKGRNVLEVGATHAAT